MDVIWGHVFSTDIISVQQTCVYISNVLGGCLDYEGDREANMAIGDSFAPDLKPTSDCNKPTTRHHQFLSHFVIESVRVLSLSG